MSYFDFKNSIQELLDNALMETDDVKKKIKIIDVFMEACEEAQGYASQVQDEIEEEMEEAEPTPDILNDNNYEEVGTPLLDFLQLING